MMVGNKLLSEIIQCSLEAISMDPDFKESTRPGKSDEERSKFYTEQLRDRHDSWGCQVLPDGVTVQVYANGNELDYSVAQTDWLSEQADLAFGRSGAGG